MNHPIVLALYQSFVRRGFATLRFNFRGVGRSQGTFDNGIGELSDAASALDWMQQFNPEAHTTWVAGFSFGAWIGMQLLMRRPEIKGFISIAPPANMYDFSFLAPCPSSGIIVDGEVDEVVPPSAVIKLVDKLKTQRHIAPGDQGPHRHAGWGLHDAVLDFSGDAPAVEQLGQLNATWAGGVAQGAGGQDGRFERRFGRDVELLGPCRHSHGHARMHQIHPAARQHLAVGQQGVDGKQPAGEMAFIITDAAREELAGADGGEVPVHVQRRTPRARPFSIR
jgi:alpha/beta superfamily hydrolase